MGTIDLPKNPTVKRAANKHGSENVHVFEGNQEFISRIIKEETCRLIDQLSVSHIDTKGGLKEQISDCINRNYQNLVKILPTDEENKNQTLTIKELHDFLNSLGGANKFNTGEIEKTLAVRRGIKDLENYANRKLRNKDDIGALVNADSGCSIVKCVFRDNAHKPKTVTDVKLSINVPDAELISPVLRFQAQSKYLISGIIGRHIFDSIISDSQADVKQLVAGITVPDEELSSRLNSDTNPGIEAVRGSGFTLAANSLVSILDEAKLSFQYLENFQNRRELVIREYEDADTAGLPDERYQLRLKYCNRDQIIEDRNAYDAQMKSFELEVQHVEDLLEVMYQDSKSVFKVNDFDDLSKKNKSRIKALIKDKTGEPLYESVPRQWDEVSFVRPMYTDDKNPSYQYEKDNIRARLTLMCERIKNMTDFLEPVERLAVEDRISWLEKEYCRFEYSINPHHVQPGIILDLDITSIKRKKTTLDSMAAVLGEFLRNATLCFQQATA